MIRSVFQDARYALRSFRRTPGIVGIAVVSLALGIGGNVSVYSVVNGVLLRPLPYRQPERLALVFLDNPKKGVRHGLTSYENYHDWRAQNVSFEDLAAFNAATGDVRIDDADPEPMPRSLVSPHLFSLLGVAPLLGRSFGLEDVVPDSDSIVIGYGLWRSRFGSDPTIVGRGVRLDGVRHTVVGVMPPGFAFPNDTKIWFPWNTERLFTRSFRGNVALSVVGRLKTNVTWEQAWSEMVGIGQRLARDYPVENEGTSVSIEPLVQEVAAPVRQPLRALWAAAGIVLMIACANIANLLLARGASRTREVAVRIAIGASRGRIVQLMLVESAVIATAGGALGFLLGWSSIRALVAAAPAFVPRLQEIGVGVDVLLFSIAATASTVFLFGLAPALLVSGTNPQKALRTSNRTTPDRRGNRLRRGLVALEIALSLVLLIVAGLAFRSLHKLEALDYGLDVGHLATVVLAPPRGKDANGGEAFYRDVNERVAAIPGVTGVAETSSVMLEAKYKQSMSVPFEIADRTPDDQPRNVQMQMDVVSAGYFATAGIPVLAGQEFDASDSSESATPPIIVNETLARTYWPGESPIGKRLRPSDPNFPNPWWTVKCVVADTIREGPGVAPNSESYIPGFNGEVQLVARTSGDPAALAVPIRAAIRDADPSQYVAPVRAMTDVLGDAYAERRLVTRLISIFALCAVIIAAVGIFGLMSYLVSQRTMEIGVRLALGALPSDIVRSVLAESIAVLSVGLAVGLASAAGTARFIAHMLFGVGPLDVPTYTAVTTVLAAVALLASFIPARSASRVDAMKALRSD